jgi:hypothetical protein
VEARIEITLKQISRFHDMHIGIDEAQTFFHWNLLIEVGLGMDRFTLRRDGSGVNECRALCPPRPLRVHPLYV